MASWSTKDLPTPNPPLWERPDGWRERAVRLVEVYNQCLARAAAGGGFPSRPKRQTTEAHEVFHGLERFTLELGVDATAWIFACHAALSWKKPVSMRVLFNPKYKRVLDELYEQRYREIGTLKGHDVVDESQRFRPFVDLYPGAEHVKRRYQAEGRADRCLAALEVTYGFHPESEVCPECPLLEECKARTAAARGDR